MSPCSPALAKAAPDACHERPGFDRARFHQMFDANVVRFFREKLE
jgi:hypothetical protein